MLSLHYFDDLIVIRNLNDSGYVRYLNISKWGCCGLNFKLFIFYNVPNAYLPLEVAHNRILGFTDWQTDRQCTTKALWNFTWRLLVYVVRLIYSRGTWLLQRVKQEMFEPSSFLKFEKLTVSQKISCVVCYVVGMQL